MSFYFLIMIAIGEPVAIIIYINFNYNIKGNRFYNYICNVIGFIHLHDI